MDTYYTSWRDVVRVLVCIARRHPGQGGSTCDRCGWFR